jgi:hypothetical protein
MHYLGLTLRFTACCCAAPANFYSGDSEQAWCSKNSAKSFLLGMAVIAPRFVATIAPIALATVAHVSKSQPLHNPISSPVFHPSPAPVVSIASTLKAGARTVLPSLLIISPNYARSLGEDFSRTQ